MPKVVYKVGNDLSTDVIYPGRFMATVLPAETPAFAFADDGAFNCKLRAKQIAPGSIVLGGENFGCGSSREQAVSCLKGYELLIVARGFARIFLQNAINLGLRVVISPDLEAEEGDELQVTGSKIRNLTHSKEYAVEALPSSRQVIIDAGGLISYTRVRLMQAAAEIALHEGRRAKSGRTDGSVASSV